jgi:mRNA interferase RelE/StbE
VTYRLVYTHRAVRDIAALDPKTRARIGTQLGRFEEDPLRYAELLVHSSLGSFRFRIGDYRVIFDLEGEESVILRVGHRPEIYRR